MVEPLGSYDGNLQMYVDKGVEWDAENPPPKAQFYRWLYERGRLTEFPFQPNSRLWRWDEASN